MLIDLNEVLKGDGKTMQAEVPLTMDSYSNGTGTFPIVSNQPVSLLISNKGNKELQITGSVIVVLTVPCDRCLEDVQVSLELEIDREVDMNQTEEERHETLDEQFYIEGYNLDVDKLVCSEILVSWPSKVLCMEDCKGLCNTCGTNLNLKTCDCEPTDLDPRMAQIQEIFSEFKEV